MKKLFALAFLLVAGCGADVEGWLQPPDFATAPSLDMAAPAPADMAAARDLALPHDLAHAADLAHEDGGCHHHR